MKILLESEFAQFELLSAKEFLEFLKKRGIHRNISDLEFYDETKIVKPVLRLHGSLKDSSFKHCDKTLTLSSLYPFYENDLVKFPTDEDFKPWDSWKDKYEDKVCMYYHPFQLLGFEHVTKGVQLRLAPRNFLNATDPVKYFDIIKKKYCKELEGWQTSVKDAWLSRIGFLMLLEEAYAINVRQHFTAGLPSDDSFGKWKEWRFNKFSPENILKHTNFKIDEIKSLYNFLASDGQWNDPIENWFPLQRILKRSQKQKLRGKALVSQDYYEMAEMVAHFIYDLTKERMSDPDDMGNEGWKERIFGKPFDYNSKKTQKAILDHYLFYRPPLIALIYEGETEHEIIKKIFDALYVYDEKSGIIRCNARGADNIAKNFEGYFEMAKENEINVFVIVDKDNESIVTDHTRNGTIKDAMYLVWNNDFECDNFGVQSVVKAVNELLKAKMCKEVEIVKIEERMKKPGTMLMNAMSKEIQESTGQKFSDLVSKPDLADKLMQERLEEIRKERNSDGWKPKLPIEKTLQQIFRMIPFIL